MAVILLKLEVLSEARKRLLKASGLDSEPAYATCTSGSLGGADGVVIQHMFLFSPIFILKSALRYVGGGISLHFIPS